MGEFVEWSGCSRETVRLVNGIGIAIRTRVNVSFKFENYSILILEIQTLLQIPIGCSKRVGKRCANTSIYPETKSVVEKSSVKV